MADKLQAILDAPTADGIVPGVVAMATTADRVLWHGASGVRDLSTGARMTEDTVFRLHSMTKAITSVAAMQLVEKGLLSLDAPIAEILPMLADPMVVDGFDAAGTAILRPARTTMTLRHLLTHSSGYGYEIWNADLARVHASLGLPARPHDWDSLAQEPLLFDPGTDWNYSISTDVVGKAVEAASGLSLGEYFASYIFRPLGMTDTGFAVTDAMRSRSVAIHARQPDGSAVAMAEEAPAPAAFMNGGGGLRGTAADYIRFLRMLLGGGTLGAGGSRILAPETVALMGQNHIGDLAFRPMLSAIADRSNDADFFPGMIQKWGLGFLLNTEAAPSGRSAGGMAWAGLANTYFWIDPVRGIAGVVLAQVFPFADTAVLDLLWKFEAGVYAAA
jgi:methyl acetate hydrolase